MIVLIINGYPRSGKDEFVNAISVLYNVSSISTIQTVKQAAEVLGWDGKKTPEMRNFLSDMKDMWTKYMDGPYNEIVAHIKCKRKLSNTSLFRPDFVTIMSREPDEIGRLVSFCNEEKIHCKTVLIKRSSGEETNHKNTGDSSVENYDYDFIFYNDGTLEEWRNYSLHMAKYIQVATIPNIWGCINTEVKE